MRVKPEKLPKKKSFKKLNSDVEVFIKQKYVFQEINQNFTENGWRENCKLDLITQGVLVHFELAKISDFLGPEVV